MKFEELNLNPALLKGIQEAGYVETTDVQAKAVPAVLKGHDIIVRSKTGSGKTAAFSLPILNTMNGKGIEAVVLVPTRELAMQVAKEMKKLGKHTVGSPAAVYGGTDIKRQIHDLRGKNIIVGTPGRFIDLYKREELRLDLVRTLVLDEADRMLDMGFQEDIEFILSKLPKKRQNLLFSATMPPQIQKIAHKYMHNPEKIFLTKDEADTKMIEQTYIGVPDGRKLEALGYILKHMNPHLSIIFCRTKRTVDWLNDILNASNFKSLAIHGNLTQSRRDSVMKQFREKHISILVASDVAARGIDIDDISHVINFDLPDDPDTYVHRIGRTGRAGRTGKAISIITTQDNRLLENIERKMNTRLKREHMDPELKIPHMVKIKKSSPRGGGGRGNFGGPRQGGKPSAHRGGPHAGRPGGPRRSKHRPKRLSNSAGQSRQGNSEHARKGGQHTGHRQKRRE